MHVLCHYTGRCIEKGINMNMMLVMVVVVMTVGLVVKLLLDDYMFHKAHEARHAQYVIMQEVVPVISLDDIVQDTLDDMLFDDEYECDTADVPQHKESVVNVVHGNYNYTDDFTVEADDTEIDTPRYVSGMRRAAVLKSSYICMDSIDDEREYSRNRRNYSKIYKVNKHSRVKAAWKNYDPEYLEYSE